MDGIGQLILIAFLGAVATIVAIIVLAIRRGIQKVRRTRAMKQAAVRLKMSFSARDPVLGREQFAVLTRGEGSGTQNFLSGVWRGNHVTVFDAHYHLNLTTHDNPFGLRIYRRYTMAVTRIAENGPHVVISNDGWLKSRLLDRKRLRRRRFESDDFNKRFTVRCDDERFASAFVDPRLMRWLLSTKGYRFEILGNYLVCWTRRTKKLELLMFHLLAFRDRVPDVAWEIPKTRVPERRMFGL